MQGGLQVTSTATASLPAPKSHTPTPEPTPDLDIGAMPADVKGVEVQLWHGWDGSSASLLEQMAAEYNLTNPWGITIHVTPLLNLTRLDAAVSASQGGTPGQPDLVIALPEHILGWHEQVLDLTKYAAQAEIGLPEGMLQPSFAGQSILNGVRSGGTVQTPPTFGGTTLVGEAPTLVGEAPRSIGVPAARMVRLLFYNQGFAKELGFDKAPVTVDEFTQQACAANAWWKTDQDLTNDGYGGLALDLPDSANWQTAYSWLAAGGGGLLSDGKLKFNTPENVKALGLIETLREKGCAWQPDGSVGNFDQLAARRALFVSGDLSDIPLQQAAMQQAGSADAWTVIAFPGVRAGIVPYGPDYAILKSDPKRQLAAWLFMRWLLEPQNQVRWSRGTGLLPVSVAALKMQETDITLSAQWKAALALLPQSINYPQTADWALANKILADGMMAYQRSYPLLKAQDLLEMMDSNAAEVLH